MASGPTVEVNGVPPSEMPNEQTLAREASQNGETESNGAAQNGAPSTTTTLPHHWPPPPNYHAPAIHELPDHTVENFRPLRVICIGAGFSGIYMGIRIPELLRNVALTIYEKNTGMGGTWWENRYPGVACDIPAHSYMYSFEPNRDWSEFYASGPEIQRYLLRVADKYSVGRFVKLNHKVTRCEWDEDRGVWKVDIEKTDTGEVVYDEAEFIINARGGLNDFRYPDIEGLKSFEGKLVHSADWDTSYDYSNKKVGVIGNGSSAIQIVPQMQKLPGVDLKVFMRSRTWIAFSFGESMMLKLELDHLTFTDEDLERFHDDEKYHDFRKIIESDVNSVHNISLRGSAFAEGARQMFTDLMNTRLKKRPELAKFLIPSFSVGCRRLTPGPGFLEALCEDNVESITTPIKKITPKGVELSNGKHVDLDVLVCATGFNPNAMPFPVIGMGKENLQDRFKPYPEAYLSLAVDKYPNFMIMLGPNSGVGSGSLTKILETLGDYIIKAIRKIQKEDIKALHVKPARVRDWSAHVDAYFPRTVYLDDCQSWYRSERGRGTRIVGLWPGSTLHAIETLRSPRWEDYEYGYEEEGDDPLKANRLRWLGNGWSELQLKEGGDMSYYIEDEFVDVPSAPLPEKTPKWNHVSFSY